MKYLKMFLGWIIGASSKNKEQYIEESAKEQGNQDFEDLRELEEYATLQTKKYKAIAECKGCENEVFVLVKDGVEIDYQPNLNKLATENNLNASNVYRYFKNTNSDKKLLLGRYHIINYKSE